MNYKYVFITSAMLYQKGRRPGRFLYLISKYVFITSAMFYRASLSNAKKWSLNYQWHLFGVFCRVRYDYT